jgi:phytoene dehydrogenase-like protein
MMERKYDVIVVGAGVAGLGVAALLAQAGKQVLVLEKKQFIGGRAATFQKEGVIRSFGQHVLLQGLKYDELLAKLGVTPPTKAFFDGIYTAYQGRLQNIDEVIPLIIATAGAETVRMDALLAPETDLLALDDVAADRWLKSQISCQPLIDIFELAGAIICTIPRLEEIAASSLYATIQLILHHRNIWVAADGLQSFHDKVAKFITDNNGTILTEALVRRVILKGKEVKGIEGRMRASQSGLGDTKGRFEALAPVVVLALPLWEIFSLLPPNTFPSTFQEQAEPLSLLTANVGLTALLSTPVYTGKHFYMVKYPTSGSPGSFYMATNVAPQWAPSNMHLFEASTICNYDEVRRNPEFRAKLLEGMQRDLHTWFPDWDKDAYWISSYIHLVEPKRASRCTGKHRFENQAPGITGLYFAGDSYASRALPGIETASDSAMQCVRHILD